MNSNQQPGNKSQNQQQAANKGAGDISKQQQSPAQDPQSPRQANPKSPQDRVSQSPERSSTATEKPVKGAR